EADVKLARLDRSEMGALERRIALNDPKNHVVNPAGSRGALTDCVEDWLHVRRRAADDAEHFRRRGLVLQRLVERRVALLELVEKAHVFDGDDGLVGERLHERDLT